MIELKNISKTYRAGNVPVPALQNVDLSIAPGEFVAIMGPSGSGKSTLLHLLGFLDRPDSGSYRLFSSEVSGCTDDELASLRNHLAGFVFQQFHLLPRVSAVENTQLPLLYAGKAGSKEIALAKLEAVGLSKRSLHRSNEMSGGEQQRVAIARALANDPDIIFADEPTGNLDTKSEEAIMRILDALNREGKTVIMVTHEKEVAERARRIIAMRDGKIVSDERKVPEPPRPPGAKSGVFLDKVLSERHFVFGRMEFLEHLRQSVRSILANKVRSFLSMLGIFFGVGAVIAMMALGEGAKASIEQRLKSMGSNLLSVRGGSARMFGAASGAGTVTRLTPGDVEAIRGISSLVRRAAGSCRGTGQIVFENENWNTSIEGVDHDFGVMRASVPEVGRWFTIDEIAGREKVVVVGMSVVEKLFGGRDPIGKTVKINRINFKVIGIAPAKGSMGPRDQDDVVYIPLTTAMYRVLGKDYLDQIYVEALDVGTIDAAQEEIRQMIRKRHRIFQDEDSFEIRNMSEIQEMLSSTTRTMSMLLGSIAAISLLVGGIGIMNIMLVSVTERTREIGLRKAIGARNADILSQFLIESVVMTFFGGGMGVLLGSGAAFVMALVLGWATSVSVFSIVLATTFSVAVGIGFGLWPAQKAARLNPIEALRYE